ncbi:hypothetical protein RDI58_015814 [Solanum bulbocastanum]|uniref:NB-ARC domain-containing protein n=1 Tax=Solanum bulbocastanum TaxID=147425 RepID=A0AAN8TG54_SOLBU
MELAETCDKGTLSSGEPSNKHSITSIYDDGVVGFEKDAEIIMMKLIRGTKEQDLISIYGMPGLGKTTLARKVYNNPSIVNHFDVKAWCAVSQAYNRRTLLVEIFKQATNDDSEIKEDDDIADMLRKSLIGKRYLIVLDDIWDVEAWEDLGICFPQGLQVALHCKGLPLVVVLIAGIIAKTEREASLWLEVANDLSSIALGEQSMKIIQSSYDHLEDHLKPCLLYMGLFPEDHKIPVDHLLKLWMAEEFVLNSERENMEEASRNCLSDLLNRSLVMVSGMRINRDVKYCSLHDVVREFCLRKLTEDKYMLLTVPYNPYQHLCSTKSRLCIYIHDDLVEQLDHTEYQLDKIPMLDFKETNSLEFIAHPKLNIWNNLYSNPLDLVVKLRFVRALHLMEVELSNSWATAMQSLTRLRYLALFVKQFELKWISHLHDLQTLHLKSSKRIRLNASTLSEMTRLRHVNVDGFSLVWEDNDEGSFEESSTTMLESMKTFGNCEIDLYNMNARFLWSLPNLEELGLCVKDVPEFPLFPIPEVHIHLHSLFLHIYLPNFCVSFGWERYFVFPSNLRHLNFSGCVLTEEMVLNIARLKKLESLTLKGGSPFGGSESYCWDVTNVEFRTLKYLTLLTFQMVKWKASEESFPMLEELSLDYSLYLKEIPPSFADIPTLRLIKLSKCIQSLGVSAMNIKREIEENTGCDSLLVAIKSTSSVPFNVTLFEF